MFKIETYDNVLNAVDELFKYYFKYDFRELELLEDGVYYAYDTSIHGSPHYQYVLLTKDSNLILIYKELIALRENITKYRLKEINKF